jgi:hypothetical protein
MKALFKSHPYAATGFVLAACLTLFFTVRIISSAIYWADPDHRNQTVKPWMTAGYIGKSWDLPPADIDSAAGLPSPQGHGPWTMQQIADDRGIPVADLIIQVNAVVAKLAAERPAHD